MIVAHYEHRLPADYDLGLIRSRAQERGPLWDAKPELYFKGFLLRESGRFGATTSSYSSLYLWRHDEAFRDFLVNGGYKIVVDMFGRARIETRVALDARKGAGREARFAYRQDVAIPPDADLAAAMTGEIERNADLSARAGIVAAVIGLDAEKWVFIRVLLSENEQTDAGACYQILHLAQPLLDRLPHAT
ncbi:DUF4865 family protein [Tardiphaga sp. P9-11]|jgi:hypothetical protein|uniref:DUF4865 family protein n=1 Tax=Tardiphaga sp. P9-11 TaxID=2024614 RepID=UPI0011F1E8CC|nr:DUF4865 family protein [Tardiphaga sp. P9-11]KAA0076742.1 DUF4865 family protein [Tardiphaga sp. P9-11]